MERLRNLELYEGPWYSEHQVKIADAELAEICDILIPLGMFISEISDELLYSEGFDSKEKIRDFFISQYGKNILQECIFSIIFFKVKEGGNDGQR